MRNSALTLAMVVVPVVSAIAGPAGAIAAAESTTDHGANVAFSGGTSGGSTVIVDEWTTTTG